MPLLLLRDPLDNIFGRRAVRPVMQPRSNSVPINAPITHTPSYSGGTRYNSKTLGITASNTDAPDPRQLAPKKFIGYDSKIAYKVQKSKCFAKIENSYPYSSASYQIQAIYNYTDG